MSRISDGQSFVATTDWPRNYSTSQQREATNKLGLPWPICE